MATGKTEAAGTHLVDKEVGSRVQMRMQLWQATAKTEALRGFQARAATFRCSRCLREGTIVLERKGRGWRQSRDAEVQGT